MPRRKGQITVTIPQDLVDWLDSMVGQRVFANKSHGVELSIRAMREAEEKRPKR
jgi:Arc/MetJ-type ribon-helix-helix transcriptional regulator